MSNTDTISPENISTDIQVQQEISQLQQHLANLTVDQASELPSIVAETEAFQKIEKQLDGTFEKRIEFAGIYNELEQLAADRNLENSKIHRAEEALPSIKKQAAREFFTQAILPSLQELTSLLNEYEPQFNDNGVLEKHLEGIRLIEKSLVQSLIAQGFTPPVVEVDSIEVSDQASELTTDTSVETVDSVTSQDSDVSIDKDTLATEDNTTENTTAVDPANHKE